MSEPEAVKMMFACGPGICDMDVSRDIAGDGGVRIFAGGAEGMLKVSVGCMSSSGSGSDRNLFLRFGRTLSAALMV